LAVAAKNLVVVESPTKARTLERMLGPDYKVEASFGHIRDLPKSKMGVNLKTFVPEYIVPDDSEKHARTLRREAKAADHIWPPPTSNARARRSPGTWPTSSRSPSPSSAG
jgi:DNA topoisomerase I